jgi:hypothetical protein
MTAAHSSYMGRLPSSVLTPGLQPPARQRAALRRACRGAALSPACESWSDDCGAATAEYAIATMAAVGFASLLVVIMRSDEVRGILTDLVRSALTVGG